MSVNSCRLSMEREQSLICGTALIQLVSTQHYYPHLERRHYTDESLTPYQRGNYFQSYIPNNYQSVPQYRRPIRRIYEDDMPRYRRSDAPIISSNEGNGRLLSPSTFDRISETLGALNTVGRYIVNMTRGGGQEQDLDPNVESDADLIERRTESVPNAILTLTKNVLGERVEKTIVEPIIKTVAPAVIEDVPEKKLVKKDAGKKKEVIEQPVVTRKEDKIEEISPKRESDEEITEKDGSNRCRTPEGRPGRCEDLSNCPSLLLDLTHLRESLCFKALFVPGVCCPSETTVLTTQKPIKLTPRPTPPTTTKSSLILTPQNPTTTSTIRPLVPLYTVSNTPTIRPIVSNEFEGSIVDPNDCGQQEYTSGRIVGGIEAPNGNWPWMAAIFLHGPKRTEFWCGGSLIGTKYILTAAHCTRDSKQRPFAARQFTVRLGDIDLSTDSEPSAPVTFKVKEVRAHPQFSRVGFYNDIAILVLEQPVRKSKYVIPVCLPQPALTTKERLSGRRATVIGFGTTYYGGKESPNLRQASLPIWRNEDCNRAYFQPITDNFLCAGYSEGNVDACQGDSGGPLMMQIEARWTQLGIVSFGNKCGEPGYPGVYTRISEYLEWIEQNTRN